LFGDSFRAKSTKTRIETIKEISKPTFSNNVLEQNPPKQGLKLFVKLMIKQDRGVLEQNPPKQGLKQNCFLHRSRITWVLEQNPPKQGLKPPLFGFHPA